jgi:hypothetical protein
VIAFDRPVRGSDGKFILKRDRVFKEFAYESYFERELEAYSAIDKEVHDFYNINILAWKNGLEIRNMSAA